MDSFLYNDMEFTVESSGQAWDILRRLPGGGTAVVGAGLFPNVAANDIALRALALVKTVYPVGVKIVGPDVAHAHLIGDLKIVGPDVAHPNFIYLDKDSTSFPRQP
jgi:hypothetical protein